MVILLSILLSSARGLMNSQCCTVLMKYQLKSKASSASLALTLRWRKPSCCSVRQYDRWLNALSCFTEDRNKFIIRAAGNPTAQWSHRSLSTYCSPEGLGGRADEHIYDDKHYAQFACQLDQLLTCYSFYNHNFYHKYFPDVHQ